MKRLGVVLSAVAMAAGAAVMGGSAAAGQGTIEWKDSEGRWHEIVNPKDCNDTPDGVALKNKTTDPVVLYSKKGCDGMIVYTVGVGKSVPPPDVNFESIWTK
ncbi:hypothetical protein [Actinopolyspora mortivallis]|uniref:hypothetical protein n=1 Tax=Actinopolyspora mortivallis TaxID=33906 RepID=UPI0011B1CFB3|nr:hypothetical protein [Actinopolyspora mortivallis]